MEGEETDIILELPRDLEKAIVQGEGAKSYSLPMPSMALVSIPWLYLSLQRAT